MPFPIGPDEGAFYRNLAHALIPHVGLVSGELAIQFAQQIANPATRERVIVTVAQLAGLDPDKLLATPPRNHSRRNAT